MPPKRARLARPKGARVPKPDFLSPPPSPYDPRPPLPPEAARILAGGPIHLPPALPDIPLSPTNEELLEEMSPPYSQACPSDDPRSCDAMQDEEDEDSLADPDFVPGSPLTQEGQCLVLGNSRDLIPDLQNLNLEAFASFHSSNFAAAHALLKRGVDVTRVSVVSAQLNPADWQATIAEGKSLLALFPQVRLVHCIPAGSSMAFGGLDSEDFEQLMIPAAPHPLLFPALAALFLALDEGFRHIATLGLEVLSVDFNERGALVTQDEALLINAALAQMNQEFGDFTIDCLSDLGCH